MEDNKASKKTMQFIMKLLPGYTLAFCVLLIGSIFSGSFLKDLIAGAGSDFFQQSIYINSAHMHNDHEYLSY